MQLPLLLALFALKAHAGYDTFSFFTNSNDTATCPDLGFGCNAPNNICAHEAVIDKYYCCSGSDYPLCRAYASEGDSDNGACGSGQFECNENGATWCCLSGKEQCTQRTGQTNICVATQTNIIANLSSEDLQQEFSSLSSANPSATSFSFDATQLAAAAASSTASSSSSASTSSASATSTSTASATSTPQPSSSGLSSGAITGVIIGCLAGLAIIAEAAWFILRQRRRKQQWHADSGPSSSGPSHPFKLGEGYTDDAGAAYYRDGSPAAPQYQLAEMGESHEPSEMPAGQGGKAADRTELLVEPGELPGSNPAGRGK